MTAYQGLGSRKQYLQRAHDFEGYIHDSSGIDLNGMGLKLQQVEPNLAEPPDALPIVVATQHSVLGFADLMKLVQPADGETEAAGWSLLCVLHYPVAADPEMTYLGPDQYWL